MRGRIEKSKMENSEGKVCRFSGCGRPVRTRRLCQTHYKLLRQGKPLRPIAPKRPPRQNTEKLSGLSLTHHTANIVRKSAERKRMAISAVVVDVLEMWARRQV